MKLFILFILFLLVGCESYIQDFRLNNAQNSKFLFTGYQQITDTNCISQLNTHLLEHNIFDEVISMNSKVTSLTHELNICKIDAKIKIRDNVYTIKSSYNFEHDVDQDTACHKALLKGTREFVSQNFPTTFTSSSKVYCGPMNAKNISSLTVHQGNPIPIQFPVGLNKMVWNQLYSVLGLFTDYEKLNTLNFAAYTLIENCELVNPSIINNIIQKQCQIDWYLNDVYGFMEINKLDAYPVNNLLRCHELTTYVTDQDSPYYNNSNCHRFCKYPDGHWRVPYSDLIKPNHLAC